MLGSYVVGIRNFQVCDHRAYRYGSVLSPLYLPLSSSTSFPSSPHWTLRYSVSVAYPDRISLVCREQMQIFQLAIPQFRRVLATFFYSVPPRYRRSPAGGAATRPLIPTRAPRFSGSSPFSPSKLFFLCLQHRPATDRTGPILFISPVSGPFVDVLSPQCARPCVILLDQRVFHSRRPPRLFLSHGPSLVVLWVRDIHLPFSVFTDRHFLPSPGRELFFSLR